MIQPGDQVTKASNPWLTKNLKKSSKVAKGVASKKPQAVYLKALPILKKIEKKLIFDKSWSGRGTNKFCQK